MTAQAGRGMGEWAMEHGIGASFDSHGGAQGRDICVFDHNDVCDGAEVNSAVLSDSSLTRVEGRQREVVSHRWDEPTRCPRRPRSWAS